VVVNIIVAQKKVDTVYIDETNNVISKLSFLSKTNSSIYYGLIYDLDSVVYKKLRLSYFFGKLERIKKQQLFKLLSKRNGIDTTQALFFHYSDTLKSKNDFPKENTVVSLKNGGHKHLNSYNRFLKIHKQCLKVEKTYKKTKIIHFYNINQGHPNQVGKLIWYKDYSKVIGNMFKDYYGTFKCFIVRPNGEYFVYNIRDNEGIDIKKMMNSQWDIQVKDFKKRYNSLNENY